jgi:pimeloyl-ACP methyl ester carboxylesterase
LYVRESGPENAPSVVFLHGGGVGGWMWEPALEHLRGYHAIVPDLPEHGRSAAERPFTIRGAAQQVADLIRARARGGRAHVVGLSLGAQTAVQLLALAPELVERALVTGTLVRPIPGARLLAPLFRLYSPFRNVGFLVRANMRGFGVPERYYEQFREDTRLMGADALGRVMGENAAFRLPAGLERAGVPTLVLVGEHEPGAVRASARDLLAAIPGARAGVVTGVGHNWPVEAPDLFARVARAWLAGAELPREVSDLVPASG